MSHLPNNSPEEPLPRLALKLAVAVVAVAVTAAVAFNERTVERRRAPLAESAATLSTDEAPIATTTAAAPEAGTRP